MQRSLENAADGDAAKVFGVVEVGDQNLKRTFSVAGCLGNGGDDGFKQRLQVNAGNGRVEGRLAVLCHCIEHGKIELRFFRIKIDEQIVNLVQHFLRTRVGPVDLIDHYDGLKLGLKRLRQHIPSLRQRTLCCIHQQHHSVDHLQCALNFAAKVGVARRIHDIDFAAAEVYGRVLGKDGNAALALELVRIHYSLGHLLVGAECSGLTQHGVNQSSLTMIDMGDDGDIAYRLAHKCIFLCMNPAARRREIGRLSVNSTNNRATRLVSILPSTRF